MRLGSLIIIKLTLMMNSDHCQDVLRTSFIVMPDIHSIPFHVILVRFLHRNIVLIKNLVTNVQVQICEINEFFKKLL